MLSTWAQQDREVFLRAAASGEKRPEREALRSFLPEVGPGDLVI